MQELTMLEALGQVGSGEAGEIFRKFIRGAVMSSFVDVMRRRSRLFAARGIGRWVKSPPIVPGTRQASVFLRGAGSGWNARG